MSPSRAVFGRVTTAPRGEPRRPGAAPVELALLRANAASVVEFCIWRAAPARKLHLHPSKAAATLAALAALALPEAIRSRASRDADL
mmetsp:Transcript_3822/g.12627  ORF Transcript_3822/g.12627 Transcript_3822/m.12627 type:complete len:87 (-) Transcript_3822:543-803(-)